MRIIAIANQKGGCGKTTTAINFSACLARLEKKVLVVDLDPQGHATCGFGIRAEKLPFSLYDLLSPCPGFKPSVFQVLLDINPHLALLPSFVVLGAAEEELANIPGKEKKLREVIQQFSANDASFDYIVIDCPPNLGVLTFNALHAADDIIIPIEPSFFSLHGLAKISETVRHMNQRRTVALETHALLTRFQSENDFTREIYEEVKTHFRDRLFKAMIHEDLKLKEAVAAGKSIDEYDRESQAFKDYFNLAVEFLEREWNQRLPADKLGWEKVAKQKFGPRRVVGGTLFQTAAKEARLVEIAGDFNQWIPEPLVARRGEGIWQIVLPVSSGKFRYKYIVDGEWQLDAMQSDKVENAHGQYDSYVEIA